MRLKIVRNVNQCYHYLKTYFARKSVEEPESSAQYIIAHVLGKKTLHSVNGQSRLTGKQWKHIEELVATRLSGKPLQYVLGEWDFRNLVLKLRPPILIPRPETEELVGHILDDCNTNGNATTFFEVGCGSGAICLSLLEENKQLSGVAIDINKSACELTLENARNYQLDARLKVLNMCISDVTKAFSGARFDFLVSNPPYIDTSDMEKLPAEVKDFEDHRALHGGKDGLDIVREILNVAPDIVADKGNIWLEVDSKHSDILKKGPWPGLTYVKTIRDYRNVSRFCQLKVFREEPPV